MKKKWPDGTPRSTGNAFTWNTMPREPIAKTWNSGYRASESREKNGSQSMKLKGSLPNCDPKYFHIFTRA